MDNFSQKNSIKGFSLVELMVVLSIISIVSALALPSYINMKIRAGQLEAKQNLNHIYTLQVAYYSENDSYGRLDLLGFVSFGGVESGQCDSRASGLTNDIGFHVADACKLRYTYSSNKNHDAYNQNWNCGDSCFTAAAYSSREDWGEIYSDGKGFGIPISSCELWGSPGYSDQKVINQDKEMGYFGQGAGQIDDLNALEQCK